MHSHQVMCLHSLSKSEVIEGKIAQILDEVIMHSHIQTKLDPIWSEVIDAQPHTTEIGVEGTCDCMTACMGSA